MTTKKVEPCHLCLNAPRGRKIKVIGGSGHDDGGGKIKHPSFCCKNQHLLPYSQCRLFPWF
jgi:hypothetical protein